MLRSLLSRYFRYGRLLIGTRPSISRPTTRHGRGHPSTTMSMDLCHAMIGVPTRECEAMIRTISADFSVESSSPFQRAGKDDACVPVKPSGRDAGVPRRPRPAACHRHVIATHDRAAPSRQCRTARPFQGDRHALRRRARQAASVSISRRRGAGRSATLHRLRGSNVGLTAAHAAAPWPSVPDIAPSPEVRQVPDGRARLPPRSGCCRLNCDFSQRSWGEAKGRRVMDPSFSQAPIHVVIQRFKMVSEQPPSAKASSFRSATREIRWIEEKNPDARHSLIADMLASVNSTMTKAYTGKSHNVDATECCRRDEPGLSVSRPAQMTQSRRSALVGLLRRARAKEASAHCHSLGISTAKYNAEIM